MRWTVWLFLLCSTVVCAVVDPRPLERHLREIEATVHPLAARPYVLRANGKVQERYEIGHDAYIFHKYAADGTLTREWTLHKNGQISYETWYAPKRSRERLLEDDRTISYTSFYSSGQKWEEYARNKEKGITTYFVYDRDGKLINDL